MMEFSIDSLFMKASLKDVVSILLLVPAYWLLLAIYNVSPLHPLYEFPGPRAAAATYFCEAYYDWWKLGMYGKRIKRMHEKYGRYT